MSITLEQHLLGLAQSEVGLFLVYRKHCRRVDRKHQGFQASWEVVELRRGLDDGLLERRLMDQLRHGIDVV